MSNAPIKKLLIVGGGTAGWLTAAIVAAEHANVNSGSISVTLIESSDIPTIGVGEGTWPSMRHTLSQVGIDELEFIRFCDVTFKQGSKFIDWKSVGHHYYHPYSLPHGYVNHNLVPYWDKQDHRDFAYLFSSQPQLCDAHLAPKQIGTPPYAGVTNYGYHLDAGKFATFLKKHCIEKLGVEHLVDTMTGVKVDQDGYLTAVATETLGDIEADLFIDCTGLRATLLNGHYGVEFSSQRHILFNDSALAVRVPYSDKDSPIASATYSTAQDNGWVWDIGVKDRRGTGYTFASDFQSEESARENLIQYHKKTSGHLASNSLDMKLIKFEPGYRKAFWVKNCLAIGMSAGFLEPLEATAIALIEKAATVLRDEMPVNRITMRTISKRYNTEMTYRWERIIDFLKLHYVLSQREDSEYWKANKQPESIPDSLKEMLELWQYQPPSRYDVNRNEEIFPSASYQYVLYGMGFRTQSRATSSKRDDLNTAEKLAYEISQIGAKQHGALPTHRALINYINQR